jgi:AcrR family transcriptional regulator
MPFVSTTLDGMRETPRSRPAKPPLSREAVLEAGLRVLRAKGIEGVTMRAVAAELDTGPASLYVYVSNRQQLLNEMFDLVAGEVDLGDAPDPARWREQIENLLTRVLETMNRHPGIARVPLANVPTGPRAAAVADRAIEILRAGGIDDRTIAWAIDVVFLFVNAAAYEAAIYVEEGVDEERFDEELREQFGKLDPASIPNMSSMMHLLTSGDGDERFAFGLRVMIEGLLHVDPPDIG